MMTMNPRLLFFALGGLVCLVALVAVRSCEAFEDDPPGTSEARSDLPSLTTTFDVQVIKPRSARPLFGLLPSSLFGTESSLSFSHESPGAVVDWLTPRRLELAADGWVLSMVAGEAGAITSSTYLLFDLELANKNRTLRCTPGSGGPSPVDRVREGLGFESQAAEASDSSTHGLLQTRPAGDRLSGEFELQLGVCTNAMTGKTIDWPPSPLTVVGSFENLPQAPTSGP